MDYDNFRREILFKKHWFFFQYETCFGRCLRRLHFIIHKKCDIANLILVFAFKQNNDKETNLTSRKSMHSMKNNEN